MEIQYVRINLRICLCFPLFENMSQLKMNMDDTEYKQTHVSQRRRGTYALPNALSVGVSRPISKTLLLLADGS